MKKRSNVYTILIVFMFLTQQIIIGCATTETKDVQKEELIKEDPHKEVLVKEELLKEEADPINQKLYQAKCYLCHEMQDIDAYAYTPEQWVNMIDNMHDARDYGAIVTLEEDEKIKSYLKNMSQKQ